MPLPDFLDTAVELLSDLLGSVESARPRVVEGLGTLEISADSAMDGITPRATDLAGGAPVYVAGNVTGTRYDAPERRRIVIEIQRHTFVRYGSWVDLAPPEGFRFVNAVPFVRVDTVSARARVSDREHGLDLPPVPGTTLLTGEGHVRWESRGGSAPGWEGKMYVFVGEVDPLLIQPESGHDADRKGGAIMLRTNMGYASATTALEVGQLRMTGGRVSLVRSQLDADPAAIVADGQDRSDVAIRVRDTFGNPTDRDVDSVELVQDPDVATVEPRLTRSDVGLWTAGITARVAGTALQLTGLLDERHVIQGRPLQVHGVELGARISASELEPAEGATVELAITVTNQGWANASGVGVRLRLDPALEFLIVTAGTPGAWRSDAAGVYVWDSVTVPARARTVWKLDVVVERVTGAGLDATVELFDSDVADAGGAHAGAGASATVTLLPG